MNLVNSVELVLQVLDNFMLDPLDSNLCCPKVGCPGVASQSSVSSLALWLLVCCSLAQIDDS